MTMSGLAKNHQEMNAWYEHYMPKMAEILKFLLAQGIGHNLHMEISHCALCLGFHERDEKTGHFPTPFAALQPLNEACTLFQVEIVEDVATILLREGDLNSAIDNLKTAIELARLANK